MLWPTCTFLILLRMSLNVVLIGLQYAGCDRYFVLASLATLNLVTASQMAGQLCALICASPRMCVRVCVFTWVLPAFTVREHNNWQQADSGHCLKLFLKCMNLMAGLGSCDHHLQAQSRGEISKKTFTSQP